MPQISIKAARVNAGLNQSQAAKALGINKDTLSRYESGKSSPRLEMIEKMSKIYNIDLIFLKK